MNKIIINQHNFKDNEITLQQGVTTLGRASDNMIQLPDPAISSHHARIVTIFDTAYIEDLGSTNGTVVNGRKIQRHSLHHGDILSLGKMQLLFVNEVAAKKSEAERHAQAVSTDTMKEPASTRLSQDPLQHEHDLGRSARETAKPGINSEQHRTVNTAYFEHPDIDLSAGETGAIEDSGIGHHMDTEFESPVQAEIENDNNLEEITLEGIPTLDETLPLSQMRMKSSQAQVTRKPGAQQGNVRMVSSTGPADVKYDVSGSLASENVSTDSVPSYHEELPNHFEMSTIRNSISGWRILLGGLIILAIITLIMFLSLWDVPLL